ncbi:MAG: pyrroline-5-carboxylate reductase [Atribacterota bacterium]
MEQKIAIIGLGKMGNILVSSLIKNQAVVPEQVFGTDQREEIALKVQEKFRIHIGVDNQKAVSESNIIILAVKPQIIKKVLTQILPELTEDKVIISIAAGTSSGFIEKILNKSIPVIRAMPNTASLVNAGMTVLFPGKFAKEEHLGASLEIFKSIGEVETIDREELMDAVTALSGCGPAYSYVMVESLTDGGVRMGLSREFAQKLAAQAILGGAKMVLETGLHPALLKGDVTTPGGVTIDGLVELEDGGFRIALIKAIDSATQKSREISR